MRMKRILSIAFVFFASLAFFAPDSASAQATISGRVVSEQGRVLSNTNVLIPELSISVATNGEGRYTIVVPAARANGQAVSLRARHIGYTPDTRPVLLTTGTQTVDFSLREDINRLAEVVVTGVTGATEQTKVPFSVSTVTAEDLNKVPSSSPLTALAGKVPGANILSQTGRPGASPSVMLRAPTSISTSGVGASHTHQKSPGTASVAMKPGRAPGGSRTGGVIRVRR